MFRKSPFFFTEIIVRVSPCADPIIAPAVEQDGRRIAAAEAGAHLRL